MEWLRMARERGWIVPPIGVAVSLVLLAAAPIVPRIVVGLVAGMLLLRYQRWENRDEHNAERSMRALLVLTGWWWSVFGAMTMLASFTLAPNWFGVVGLFVIGLGFFVTGLPAARTAVAIVLRRH